jgi:hypothetical protein
LEASRRSQEQVEQQADLAVAVDHVSEISNVKTEITFTLENRGPTAYRRVYVRCVLFTEPASANGYGGDAVLLDVAGNSRVSGVADITISGTAVKGARCRIEHKTKQ